ncbi:MAG: hypothetical protein LBJ72_08010 [Dysgonamonadaceae bacterium]|jgi:photosystem II stability/assembly factor-like uncharacterized protein|nr:hypothetical protein [Dysgonamonadaceae bacterium]
MKSRIKQMLMTVAIALVASCQTNTETKNPSITNGLGNEWGHVGIGGGGAMFNPAISPLDPDYAYVSCDMGGSFVTHDGGKSWRMFNLSSMARFFTFDPSDPEVVYANSSGLFKSTDKGATWSLIYPKPSDVTGIVSKGDHAGESLVTKNDIRSSTVQALSVDPDRSETLYAAIKTESVVGLYKSGNGGVDWEKEKDLEHDVKNIFIDPSSPAKDRTLYITGGNGIDCRQNGSWQANYAKDENIKFNFFTGGYDGNTKKFIIYAISGISYFNREKTGSGIYYTENGGITWENRESGLLEYVTPGAGFPEWWGIATSASNPNVIYVSYAGLIVHPDTTCIGVAKSEDFGKTWILAWQDKLTKGVAIPSPNYGRDWLNERFGPTWGENPFSLAVSATHPDVCLGTDFGRTSKTADGGKTWGPVYSEPVPGGGWVTTGMEVTTGYNIIFDPYDENHVFIALTDVGLIESKDGAKSWLSATNNNGIPKAWINSTYWLIFDPGVKGKAWAVMSENHDLPRPKMFRRQGPESYHGGILLTNDAGKTWRPVSESIGETAATHILLDPESDKNSRTLYVCAFGKGVYKSTDGGLNWVQKNKGIEGDEPFVWRIERRESDGTLFLVVSRRSEDGSIGNAWDGALYKSTDGAGNWTKIELPEGCNAPTSLLTTNEYPGLLVLSAWGKVMPGKFTPDTGGGIFISADDGETWTQTMEKDQHIHDVTFDPRTNRYYACGFNASAYYSEDGAGTWTRMKGYNFKWGKRVEPDPKDPEKVYIITFGGGVWHGPAKGDENSPEDVVTPITRL